MKVIQALISILKDEVSTIKGLFGYFLAFLSMVTIKDLHGYLSIMVLVLTVIYWSIRIYKQLAKDNSKKENE